MYLLKSTQPNNLYPRYLARVKTWTLFREFALRLKAEEVIPIYQVLSAELRSGGYTIELERVED